MDEENRLLSDRLHFLLWGIAIVAGVPSIESGRFLSGGRTAERVLIRSVGSIESFYQTHGAPTPHTTILDFRSAVRFAEHLEEIVQQKKRETRLYWRLMSGLNAFVNAMKAQRPDVRLHQFVRAVESFLPPSVFGGKEFGRYACTFLRGDSRTETTVQQMYDLRSAAEHHRPFDTRTLAGVPRPEEVAMQRTRQAEAFARELYRRFFAGQGDYLAHFKDDESLGTLWSSADALAGLWGEPFDIHAVA